MFILKLLRLICVCCFVCFISMFKKRHNFSLISRELLSLFFLFLFNLHYSTVQCQRRLSKHVSSEYKDEPRRIMISIILGGVTGLGCSVIFAFLVRCVVRYLNRTPIFKGPVIFYPKIEPKTLQLALTKENSLLGSSPNGKYYKTVLDNGLTIAVKRVTLTPFESNSPETMRRKSVKRQIQNELEILASLRHRNLMSLRAYVREPDSFSLVYDYVSTGSLADLMNRVKENELQLGWEVRLRIAVGIVKGLQYLHFTCVPRILHCNLKPTNLMLDAEFEPRLADYGLAKLLPNLDRGTPECSHSCRYTDKSDIFSFGMILGALLTGKDPKDPFFGEAASGGSLGSWLQHLQQAGEAREALDKSILGEEGEEDEMLMAVRIAAACLSDMPVDRPSSDELVHMLTQLHSF
ncbi:PREDICTED: inactive leucine-rich repeat receptor-like protein kinase CORYNE isoform X2 [Lupinus angustifolius]|uniref:inactive leucine-rich repeat receptor-like protein kinase CORYNE isoform X2 n=1 Tax=Lupinus angustifolius TaxID=3871 RepID=UPI00092F6B77|nr:PREDICTED: inactive leucine-rich repeat receptor-like protein kinase CORYNE isoform X2 [Lupinus angustifolius]